MVNEMKLCLHPTEWNEDGKLRTVIKRDGNIALVGVYSSESKLLTSYEIILIKIKPVRTTWIGHKKLVDGGYTHYELFPSTAQFGTTGLSYLGKDLAETVYKAASKSQSIPKHPIRKMLLKPYV